MKHVSDYLQRVDDVGLELVIPLVGVSGVCEGGNSLDQQRTEVVGDEVGGSR